MQRGHVPGEVHVESLDSVRLLAIHMPSDVTFLTRAVRMLELLGYDSIEDAKEVRACTK